MKTAHCNSCIKRRTVNWLFLLVVVLTFFGVGLTMAASKPMAQVKLTQHACQPAANAAGK
jgi:hypothetical protein